MTHGERLSNVRRHLDRGDALRHAEHVLHVRRDYHCLCSESIPLIKENNDPIAYQYAGQAIQTTDLVPRLFVE